MEKVKTTGASYAIPPLSNARGLANTSVLISWSGGKDSCLALYEIQKAHIHVAALLTTVTRDYDRISMHGVRRELLEKQADKLGLPLHQVLISKDATNEEYEAKMAEAFSEYSKRGIDSVVFGDLFLEDIKVYREQFLARHQMRGLFPVWKRDTSSFIKEFIELGFKAVVTCVNSKVLDQSFAGRIIDEAFLSSLPVDVDPCGENGEFHSFVFDGPIFTEAVKFSIGETVLRDSFWVRDLLPE
ncbi:MAG: diphthine--ammonia ligase [Pyrinomonadaceae bacterium]|nr:diphthine--ammonia ligase [Pyrinomonadaceae bacterium]